MPYFPQLSSGAVAQYPLNKRRWLRSITNRMMDGNSIAMAEPQAELIAWDMPLAGLTAQETAEVENLFHASEGRLSTFVFLDPADNLLRWSEDLTKPVWETEPLLQVTAGVADPLGGTSAASLVNTAQATQAIEQAIDASGAFQYCFSIYLRAASPVVAGLRRTSGSATEVAPASVSQAWRRFQTSGNLQASFDQVRFGIEIPAGANLEAFGAQVDAQAAPAPYRRTTDRCGVYPESRFADDELVVTSEGPDQFSTRLRIVSRIQG